MFLKIHSDVRFLSSMNTLVTCRGPLGIQKRHIMEEGRTYGNHLVYGFMMPSNGPPGGAPVPDPNAGQQQQLAQAVPYQSTFYTGHLPTPTGEVGQFINRTVSTAGLKDRAEACFNVLNDPISDLRDLNGDNTIFTAIIMVPGTQKVKAIYGMGWGTARIGQVSPVANKMLALFGEGGADLGTPQVIVLPEDIRAKYNVRCLTDAAILTAFQGGNQAVDHQWPGQMQ